MSSETIEVTRPVGRPRSFNVPTKLAAWNIPTDTQESLREIAARRGLPINVVVDRAIRSGLKLGARKD